jgi:hypothetical protein
VDGKFYRGGQLMPVHGLYSGQAKGPAGAGAGGGPVKAEEDSEGPAKRAPARPLTPEQLEEERARAEQDRKWAEANAGPLGRLKWLGERPNGKALGNAITDLRKWKEWAGGLGNDRLAALNDVLQARHESRVDAEVTAGEAAGRQYSPDQRDWEKNEPRRQAETDSSMFNGSKKHLKEFPASYHTRQLVQTELQAGSVDRFHEVNGILADAERLTPAEFLTKHKPAAAPEVKPEPEPERDDVARDLFGRAIPKTFGGKKSVQPTMEDALREAWTQRAKEYAADAGQPITEYSASGRFKMGGEWHEVGPAEEGHPVRKVADVKPAAPATRYTLENHGAADDHVNTVHAALNSIPGHVHDVYRKWGGKVATARKVTDYMPHLKGQAPRGWPAGMTWDHADGLYHSPSQTALATSHKDSVIAGLGEQPTRRAQGVARHEYGHGVDRAAGAQLLLGGSGHTDHSYAINSQEFRADHAADVAALDPMRADEVAYLTQPGDAGPEEAFAEVFAQLHGGGAGVYDATQHFPRVTAHVKRVLDQLKKWGND